MKKTAFAIAAIIAAVQLIGGVSASSDAGDSVASLMQERNAAIEAAIQ